MNPHIVYPADAAKDKIGGRVLVQFIIEKDGTVSSAKIARSGFAPSLNEEALRVVKTLKGWTPGKMRGRPVQTSYIVPVTFKLNKEQ